MGADRLGQPTEASRLGCEELSLTQVRKYGTIASGFTSDRMYHLVRDEESGCVRWQLKEVALPQPLIKHYDAGDPNEWLRSYPDAGRPEDFKFIGCREGNEIAGILTWRPVDWNEVLCLIDVRVRAGSRGLGVGSALVSALQNECRRRRLRGITLETQTSNYPAVAFYFKHGFKIAGFHEYLYANDDMQRADVALFLFWIS